MSSCRATNAKRTRSADELRDLSSVQQGMVLLDWARRLEWANDVDKLPEIREVVAEMRAAGLALAPPGAASATGVPLQIGTRVRCDEAGSMYYGGAGTVREVEQTRHGWRYLVQWDAWSGGSEFCAKFAGVLVVLAPGAEAAR